MQVTVTMDNGQSFSNRVFAFPKVPINNLTGYGLVNADAATLATPPDNGRGLSF